jgi:hypothetical protein
MERVERGALYVSVAIMRWHATQLSRRRRGAMRSCAAWRASRWRAGAAFSCAPARVAVACRGQVAHGKPGGGNGGRALSGDARCAAAAGRAAGKLVPEWSTR